MSQGMVGAVILTSTYLLVGCIAAYVFFRKVQNVISTDESELTWFDRSIKRSVHYEMEGITHKDKFYIALCVVLFWIPLVIVQFAVGESDE